MKYSKKNFLSAMLKKILLIFIIGYISRIWINYIYNTDIFKEYTLLIYLAYYSSMFYFISFINNFNITNIKLVIVYLLSDKMCIKVENYSNFEALDKMENLNIFKPLFTEEVNKEFKLPYDNSDKIRKGKYNDIIRPPAKDFEKFWVRTKTVNGKIKDRNVLVVYESPDRFRNVNDKTKLSAKCRGFPEGIYSTREYKNYEYVLERYRFPEYFKKLDETGYRSIYYSGRGSTYNYSPGDTSNNNNNAGDSSSTNK